MLSCLLWLSSDRKHSIFLAYKPTLSVDLVQSLAKIFKMNAFVPLILIEGFQSVKEEPQMYYTVAPTLTHTLN
jgi:hypothetical protein